jgi:hypothetical protein
MIPKKLQARVINFKFAPDRLKTSGRMWAGSAEIQFPWGLAEYRLWHHGSMTETEETLRGHLYLRSVEHVDSYWHCLLTGNGIWWHEEGWFREGNNIYRTILREFGDLSIYSFTPAQEERLHELGFKYYSYDEDA